MKETVKVVDFLFCKKKYTKVAKICTYEIDKNEIVSYSDFDQEDIDIMNRHIYLMTLKVLMEHVLIKLQEKLGYEECLAALDEITILAKNNFFR
jgi:hypothetical protein